MKNINIKKNDIYVVDILDLTFEAYGVCKVDGFTLFVESVLPGERCEIRIERLEKRYGFGKVLNILEPSKDRVEIKDKVGTRIGTMPLQHMSYDAQLNFKRDLVINCFEKAFPISDSLILPTIGMENPWGYRNKAQIPVREIRGVLETGFFKRNSHDLIPIENYYIQDPIIDKTILAVRNILRDLKISAYDETNHQGIVRHIIVRRGQVSEELMIIIVTNSEVLPHSAELVERILSDVPGVVSIVQNINTRQTNVIMGNTQNVLLGSDVYYDRLFGKNFGISSKSFYQVNTIQTEVLYQKAIDFANITKEDIVIDAYCGIGTITLAASDKAKHVYGVEIVEDAIKMANKNATLNDIDNVTFEVGPAEEVMQQWVKDGIAVDVIIVDPPRKGLAHSFIEASVKVEPRSIVYVSCNPITLAKDVREYAKHGYLVEKVQPVDMFPHTTHVETVVLLSKN